MVDQEIVKSPAFAFARRNTDAFTSLAILLGMAVASIGGYRSLDLFCFGPISLLLRHPEFAPLNGREIAFLVIATAISLGIMPLVLWLKKRSLRFLPLFVIPFGWIVFLFIQDKDRVYRFRISLQKRQLWCWLGLLIMGILILIAINWDVPITRAIPSSSLEVTDDWIFVKNYDDAPIIIHLFGQYFYHTIITGVVLLYWALLKETTTSPEFRREGQFLVKA